MAPQTIDFVEFPIPYPAGEGKPPLDKQSVEVPYTKRAGQTGHYRNAAYPELITTSTHPSFPKTNYDCFERGLRIAGQRPCLGHRPWDPVTRDFAQRYEWQTYTQVATRRTDIGSGLTKLAHEFSWPANVAVGLWAVNRPEWQITAQACNAYNYVSVALYDTLGKGVVDFCIGHAEIRVVFTAAVHVPELLEIKERQAGLDAIIVLDDLDGLDGSAGAKHIGNITKSAALKRWAADRKVKLLDFKELEGLGRTFPTPHRPPKPDDMAAICYTSGTTGNPKGAVFTHQLMATVVCGHAHGGKLHAEDNDVFFSYMPLAHCYGRFVEDMVLTMGLAVAYSCGDTLRLVEDIQICKPTFMPGVPRVWNRVYQVLIRSQTIDAPGVKGALCRRAFEAKIKNLRETGAVTHFFWDRLVMNKVKLALGGRLKLAGTGSAPISPEVLEFLKVALCCEMQEGYGQTEGHGTAVKCFSEDFASNGTCGPPIGCNEVKLVDVPDMNYLSTDQPNPRGELCIRGGNVISGYYKDPKKTAETIDEEGWLHSGDVAELDEHGRFRIIDRIKNLMKLSQGEYIALEKVENVYALCPLVAQLFLYGDSLQSHVILFVVPEPEAASRLASRVLGKSISAGNMAELGGALRDPRVVEAALAELNVEAKKQHLKGFETAKQLMFLKEPFTVENDAMTPTMKIKRNVASKMLKADADRLYAEYGKQGKSAKSEDKVKAKL